MITQLLTTALLAVSLNAGPKRAVDNPNYEGHYLLSLAYADGDYTCLEIESPYSEDYGSHIFDGLTTGQTFRLDNSGYYSLDPNVGFIDLNLSGPSDPFLVKITDDAFSDYDKIEMVYGTADVEQAPPLYLLSTSWTEKQSGYYTAQLEFYYREPPAPQSVTFLLNHCTTTTTYPVVVEQGQTFTATFTAMKGYAFKADQVAEYFDYPQGALNPTYQVSNIVGDFGSYWRSATITAVVWADCTLTVSPAPLDEGALQDAYDRGYGDAKTTYENTNQFAWLKSIWTGMAAFFSIEILPNISLGFLAFAPLLVVAIVAIVRILKHD